MKKFVIAFALAATCATAFAGPRAGRKVAETLGLSDAQKQQIHDIRQADRDQNADLYASFRAKRAELRKLERAGDARAATVRTELQSLRPQVEAARRATHEKIFGVLTPEQQSKVREWRAEHRGH